MKTNDNEFLIDPNNTERQDHDLSETVEQIRNLNSPVLRILIRRLSADTKKYQWFSGNQFYFNTDQEDPESLNDQIADRYGSGQYAVTVQSPKGSGIDNFTYILPVDPKVQNPAVSYEQPVSGEMARYHPPNTSPPGLIEELAKLIRAIREPQDILINDLLKLLVLLVGEFEKQLSATSRADRFSRRRGP